MMLNEISWKNFIALCLISMVLCALLINAFILIIDPYDTLPFSPHWQRAPMCANQRFSYPMLTKRAEFDSAIFGTSTLRLMQPTVLNQKFNAKFVNLSMDGASFYEQIKMLDLFLKHHPAPKYIIFGIDFAWCDTGETLKKFSNKPLPEWMYDKNPWLHPLYMFNTHTVMQAIRQLGYITKMKKPRFGLDGYTNFLPEFSQYDLVRARKHLYEKKKILKETVPDNFESQLDIKPLAFMEAILNQKLPVTTQILFVFVPLHHHFQPSEHTCAGLALKKCKAKFIEFAQKKHNVQIFDFMIASEITLKDENYWDPMHYNLSVAARLMDSLEEGIKHSESKIGGYKYFKNGVNSIINQ